MNKLLYIALLFLGLLTPAFAFADTFTTIPSSGTTGIFDFSAVVSTVSGSVPRIYVFKADGSYAGRSNTFSGAGTYTYSSLTSGTFYLNSVGTNDVSSLGYQTFTLVAVPQSTTSCLNQTLTFCLANNSNTLTATYDYHAAAGDTTPPVITLLGSDPVNLTVGDSYTDAGATASDDTDGDITANIIVGGDIVDTGVAGTYVITYDVDDAANNSATQVTRTVIVAAAGGGGGGGGGGGNGFSELISFADEGFNNTTGFTMTAAVGYVDDNLIKLFIGAGMAMLFYLRWWILAFIIIGSIVFFAFRAFRVSPL